MILVIEGLPGSGKSTTAAAISEAWGLFRVYVDAWLPEAFKATVKERGALSQEQRDYMTTELIDQVVMARQQHQHIVIAAVILKRAHRSLYRQKLNPLIIHLEASREMLLQRLEHRNDHFFSVHSFDCILKLYEPFGDDEGFVVDANKPTPVIVSRIGRIAGFRKI